MSQSVSAPAKVILFGEHAVVYGQPAIAVPISSLRAFATIEESEYPLKIVAENLGDRHITLDSDDPLAITARLTLDALQAEIPNGTIRVRSQIPIASGLGSGAAVSSAIVRAVCTLVGKIIALEEINRIVYEVDRIHHVTPSGIDNTVIVYEQAVYFVREQPLERIMNAEAFTLIIADTGKTALTRVAVSDVADLLRSDPELIEPIIQEIGEIVKHARIAIEAGDIEVIGHLMDQNHTLLQQLSVSSIELDRLVIAAKNAGAWGAKLSGGGRGGNMIALVSSDSAKTVADALTEAGAIRVFTTAIERTKL